MQALKYVITGAGGYIGSAVTERLAKKNHDVVPIGRSDWDITTDYSPNNVALLDRPRVVFHLAGLIGVQKSWENPDQFFQANVIGTKNVLEYCRKMGAGMVYVSAYTYASSCSTPVTEDSVVLPSNPYAQTKNLAEQVCKFYFDAHGVSSVIARPFNVFGGRQSTDFLIPTIIQQVIGEKETVEVKDLNPVRDYIYIDDLVSALIRMGELLVENSLGACEVFNVGTGAGYSVGEVVHIVQKVWGTDKAVKSTNQPRKNEIPASIASIDRIQKQLSWGPQYSLEGGLRKIYSEWAKSAHDPDFSV